MKKILIFYASYGGGHLSAAKAVKQGLESCNKNLDIELIDCMKYVNKTIEKVSTTAYREMAKKAPWVWGRLYYDSQKKAIARITSKANAFLAVKLLHLLKEKKPDLIISTHPFSSQMCTYLKSKGKINSYIATILTDFKSHDQWLIGYQYTDFFFVSNESIKNELIQKDVEPSKIYVTGIPINSKFLAAYNKEEILHTLGFSKKYKTILFFGGGEFGLGKSATIAVFKCLAQDFSHIQIIAISGKNENIKSKFEEIASTSNNNIKIFEYTNKVAEYMSIADLVITKPGGLTVSESLVSKVPMLIISPIPGQEKENAEFLENNNLGIWLKEKNNTKNILSFILNTDVLLKMKDHISLFAKPNATQDICNIILNKILKEEKK